MNIVASLSFSAAALLMGCASVPSSPSGTAEEHAAHQSSGAAAVAPTSAQHDQQMKMMQDMHQKMAAAKTPEERAALMNEHKKTMQDSMAMMGQMRGGMGMGGDKGSKPSDADAMKRRMDRMEMMMQMMMDRQGMAPPAAR